MVKSLLSIERHQREAPESVMPAPWLPVGMVAAARASESASSLPGMEAWPGTQTTWASGSGGAVGVRVDWRAVQSLRRLIASGNSCCKEEHGRP